MRGSLAEGEGRIICRTLRAEACHRSSACWRMGSQSEAIRTQAGASPSGDVAKAGMGVPLAKASPPPIPLRPAGLAASSASAQEAPPAASAASTSPIHSVITPGADEEGEDFVFREDDASFSVDEHRVLAPIFRAHNFYLRTLEWGFQNTEVRAAAIAEPRAPDVPIPEELRSRLDRLFRDAMQ